LNGKISLSVELEVHNATLFTVLKRTISKASQKRKLDIVHNYASDPRCKFSIIAQSAEGETE